MRKNVIIKLTILYLVVLISTMSVFTIFKYNDNDNKKEEIKEVKENKNENNSNGNMNAFNVTTDDVTSFYVNEKKYNLKRGDVLNTDAWNPPVKNELNNKTLDSVPTLFNGITLGAKIEDVLKTFNIKGGYAGFNMEVPHERFPGETDIKEEVYYENVPLPTEFLDCLIIFGYKKVDDGWMMIPYLNLREADVIYYIDICGFEDEMYGLNEVIEIDVKYVLEEDKNKYTDQFGYEY